MGKAGKEEEEEGKAQKTTKTIKLRQRNNQGKETSLKIEEEVRVAQQTGSLLLSRTPNRD